MPSHLGPLRVVDVRILWKLKHKSWFSKNYSPIIIFLFFPLQMSALIKWSSIFPLITQIHEKHYYKKDNTIDTLSANNDIGNISVFLDSVTVVFDVVFLWFCVDQSKIWQPIPILKLLVEFSVFHWSFC